MSVYNILCECTCARAQWVSSRIPRAYNIIVHAGLNAYENTLLYAVGFIYSNFRRAVYALLANSGGGYYCLAEKT